VNITSRVERLERLAGGRERFSVERREESYRHAIALARVAMSGPCERGDVTLEEIHERIQRGWYEGGWRE